MEEGLGVRASGEVLDASSNRKSHGSAGVSPAAFGDLAERKDKTIIRRDPGGGNRDGRATQIESPHRAGRRPRVISAFQPLFFKSQVSGLSLSARWLAGETLLARYSSFG